MWSKFSSLKRKKEAESMPSFDLPLELVGGGSSIQQEPLVVHISSVRPPNTGSFLKNPTVTTIIRALGLTEREYGKIRTAITDVLQNDSSLLNVDLDLNKSTQGDRDKFCRALSDTLTKNLSQDVQTIRKLAETNKNTAPWLLYKLAILRRKRVKTAIKGEESDISKDDSSLIKSIKPPRPSKPILIIGDRIQGSTSSCRSQTPSPTKRSFSFVENGEPVFGKVLRGKNKDSKAGSNCFIKTLGSPKKKMRNENYISNPSEVDSAELFAAEKQQEFYPINAVSHGPEEPNAVRMDRKIIWITTLCTAVLATSIALVLSSLQAEVSSFLTSYL
ncbi:hypothetical protein ABW19_dt0206052 [Dactylella cylindrospora]|nr:hypothetical protein ABW19_dt0206052 [Dactylella cylindrospora]